MVNLDQEKTKLFKVLTGLLRPISGDVFYQETSLYNSDFIDLGRLEKNDWGYL